MRMLLSICGHTRGEGIRNETIQDKGEWPQWWDKIREMRLRWSRHVKRRCTDAPMRRSERLAIVGISRSRGRGRWKKFPEM